MLVPPDIFLILTAGTQFHLLNRIAHKTLLGGGTLTGWGRLLKSLTGVQ